MHGEVGECFVAVGRVSLPEGGCHSDRQKGPPEQISTFLLYLGRLLDVVL